MALKSTLTIQAVASFTSVLDLATGTVPLNFNKSQKLTNGVLANQADLIFHDQRTLGGSANEDLDLAGSLLDAFGATLTFVKIKGLFLFAAAANGDVIEIGGAASNAFINWVGDATDQVRVRPGGAFGLFAPDLTGYAVTAGTGDLLRITNADASSATYDIVIIGTSA